MRKLCDVVFVFVMVLGFASIGVCAEEVVKSSGDASGWSHSIGEAVSMLLTIVTGVVAVLVPLLMRKIMGLIGLKSSAEINAMVQELIDRGIAKAELWAKAQEQKPAGKEKMQIAVNFILDLLKEYKVPAIAQEKLIDLIEEKLQKDEK